MTQRNVTERLRAREYLLEAVPAPDLGASDFQVPAGYKKKG